MRRSRNLPLPAGRLDYIIFVSGIIWAEPMALRFHSPCHFNGLKPVVTI